MLDKATVIRTVERYAQEVVKSYNPSAIVLYGSYAKGNAHEDSDIDVAVVFKNFKGNWLETSSDLWHLTIPISLDIEPILLDSENDKSGFASDILKTGQIIYSQQ